MPAIYLNLSVSAEEYQRLYQGTAYHVLATSVDGRRVRFPAWVLQKFVTREGIRGRFCIRFNDENRFESIEKID
ncbi:DUF2835 domain-containing protein [Marinimicrobium alkaliphilum]|uniref:DUF2835 domain-containing protein n=1 Tax=Marinimicrobium alkaliphilum TaxID=2202654 RepID=UPI000DBA2BCD|nr:DUF2835 domain-containing protein [Marinimicrobium alkaliphilum]